jgi:dTDP-4-amino-4,6-dideoxygalactose transaminase
MIVEFDPWPSFSGAEVDAVAEVLRSGRVNYWTGSHCREFECEFSAWVDTSYAVALANGTVAIDLALRALEIGPGDEVVVTPRSFIASVSCVVHAGATPVFADVDLSSGNISAATIEKVLTSRTRAIICVHLAGWPCEMDDIMGLADRWGLKVIEDCAQAHGARYKGRSVGSIGHIGAWSFCQDKIMSTGGEGGMVTTNDEKLWRKMWSFKDHGKAYAAVHGPAIQSGFRWVHEEFGTNWRMTEIQAAIGIAQLKRMREWHDSRLSNALQIWRTASQISGLRVPDFPDSVVHAAYKCYVYVEPDELNPGWSRDRVVEEINKLGVPCFFGSCPEIYLEKAFDDTPWRPKVRLQNAKTLGETSLVFLVHPTLSKEAIDRTCQVLRDVMLSAVVTRRECRVTVGR